MRNNWKNRFNAQKIKLAPAIGEVLDFAEKDGNTLVVVTADHETGGYTLASENGNYNKIKGSFSTGGHSATLIPVFAYGPGSENFQGIYENNLIYNKIIQLTNWGNKKTDGL